MFPGNHSHTTNYYDNTLQSEEFPLCCGLDVLVGFGYTQDAAHGVAGRQPDKKKIEEWLKDKYEELAEYAADQSGPSAGIVALNEPQMKALWPIFQKQGFKKVAQFYHTGHENKIFLLFKPAFPNKRAAVAAVKKKEKEWDSNMRRGIYW